MHISVWTFKRDQLDNGKARSTTFPWKEDFCAYGRKCVCACVCDTRSLRILRPLELTPPLCLCRQVQICRRGRQHHQTLAAPDPCPAAGGLDRPHPPDRGCSPPQAPCLPAAVVWAVPTGRPLVPAGGHPGHRMALWEAAGPGGQVSVWGQEAEEGLRPMEPRRGCAGEPLALWSLSPALSLLPPLHFYLMIEHPFPLLSVSA